jgi:acetyltransferase-like isoleucine patch superfamily enzyme
VARVAPDVWRVRLHKWRGVKIGRNVSIGYDSIIETSYPFLISIGDNVNIGMRATIIGHFRGMVDSSAGKPTVVIEDFAFIGPGVIVLPNTQIGRGAVIAAGSVVTRNIPAMTFAQGNPVRVVARCGIPLSGRATFKEFLEQLKPLP